MHDSADKPAGELPPSLRPVFWDVDFDALSWEQHRDFIIGRVLGEGTWVAVRWLWSEVGGDGLRGFLRRRQGRGLSPRRLRFWQDMLDLPEEEVTPWVLRQREGSWGERVAR